MTKYLIPHFLFPFAHTQIRSQEHDSKSFSVVFVDPRHLAPRFLCQYPLLYRICHFIDYLQYQRPYEYFPESQIGI